MEAVARGMERAEARIKQLLTPVPAREPAANVKQEDKEMEERNDGRREREKKEDEEKRQLQHQYPRTPEPTPEQHAPKQRRPE